jgi:protoporphyrinogen oxidase
MIYDIIILGGGIAGLYCAYKLLQKNKILKILILEKNDYLGGRMKIFKKTINGHTFYQEEGAWRFNTNHKLLLKLINELGYK